MSRTAQGHSPETVGVGIFDAMLARMDPRHKVSDNGRRFMGMSLVEQGRELLEASGLTTRGMSRLEVANLMVQHRSAGGLTTSDFSSLLANVANKRLREQYQENPGSFRLWARRGLDVDDFKPITAVNLSAAPDLLKITEAGEFKYSPMTDGKETYQLMSYGRIVGFSRQAIVNDDLRGFDRVLTAFGSAAARLENRTVYAQLTGNAALSDGLALFHTSHNNLGTGAGSALQLTALASGRAAMRVQKGLQSEELSLSPAFVIGPAALEQTMYQLTSNQYTPATSAAVNEFRQGGRTSLMPVVEPLLDADSATSWYLAASTSQVDTVEYCYLTGADAPSIETKSGFEIDGLQIRCRHDFAAKALDYRGLYKAAGV